MMNYSENLTTLQARTLDSMIKMDSTILDSQTVIKRVASIIVNSAIEQFPTIYNDCNKKRYFSFVLFALARKAIKAQTLTVLEYFKILAYVKEENAQTLKDFGAFGDLFEILIRVALLKSLGLVHAEHLSVAQVKRADIITKKYGIIEVGHNGKTWTHATLFDVLAGEYTSVIYGVFDDETQADVYNACKEQNIKLALSIVTAYAVLWTDKQAFYNDMESLTRGKFFTLKSGKIMNQYNVGKHRAFINAIESGMFESLDEILKSKV